MAALPPGRTKVVNDITELVPLLRIVNTDIKRKIFQELVTNWRSLKEIESLYGEEGKEALLLFEKAKLVETKWQSTKQGKPEKVYRTYYTSFHMNAHCPITEICDLLAAATLHEKDFSELENKILEAVSKEGAFVGDVAQTLNISQTMLKGIVRRSTKLDYRGHRVEKLASEE
jgi:predicted DNA-binding ArsR family transcriptional regulator